jgi:hypothetical protein
MTEDAKKVVTNLVLCLRRENRGLKDELKAMRAENDELRAELAKRDNFFKEDFNGLENGES